jgi:hypothetical protein
MGNHVEHELNHLTTATMIQGVVTSSGNFLYFPTSPSVALMAQLREPQVQAQGMRWAIHDGTDTQAEARAHL